MKEVKISSPYYFTHTGKQVTRNNNKNNGRTAEKSWSSSSSKITLVARLFLLCKSFETNAIYISLSSIILLKPLKKLVLTEL